MAGHGRLVVGDGGVVILPAHHLALVERDDAIPIGVGLVEARLLLGQGAFGLLQRHLVGFRIDQEQGLTGGDRLTLDVGALQQDAVHPGAHIDLTKTGGLPHHLGGERNVGQLDLGHHHGHRGRRLDLAGGVVATAGQGAGQRQGDATASQYSQPVGVILHSYTLAGRAATARFFVVINKPGQHHVYKLNILIYAGFLIIK
ncbi:hypothetical protein D3C72_1604790 [compost metagenome]